MTNSDEGMNLTINSKVMTERDIGVEVETEIGEDLQRGVEIGIRKVVREREGVAQEVEGVGLGIGVVPEIGVRESLEILKLIQKKKGVDLEVVPEIEDTKGVPEVGPIVGVEVTPKKRDIEELRAKRRGVNDNLFCFIFD